MNTCLLPESKSCLAERARDVRNRDLASRIRSNLVGVWGQHDRGTKDDHNLQILKEPGFAAALVDIEFLSNPLVEREFTRPLVHQRVAQALAEAIRDWAVARAETGVDLVRSDR
jgi:N-acetylmuramoyl-L-alanine amidase